MPSTNTKPHYAILYVDEHKNKYTIFESVELDALARIYARILQFESIFRTFPNGSCHIVLEQDFNYDSDTAAWDMAYLVNEKWQLFVEEIYKDFLFAGKLGPVVRPPDEQGGQNA